MRICIVDAPFALLFPETLNPISVNARSYANSLIKLGQNVVVVYASNQSMTGKSEQKAKYDTLRIPVFSRRSLLRRFLSALLNLREKLSKNLIVTIPNTGALNDRLRLLFGRFPEQ